MRRKIILFICCTLLITACNQKREETRTETGDGGSTEEAAETYELPVQAGGIRIEDVTLGAYSEELSIALTESEILSLYELSGSLRKTADHSGSSRYFALSFLDDDGSVEERWIVDASYQIQLEDGFLIQDDESLESWLHDLEQSHGISTDMVWNREPGENYLSDLEYVSEINFTEYTETNFEDGIDAYLTDSLIEDLKNVQSSVCFVPADLSGAGEIAWQIHIYDAYGASLYDWTVYESGLIYNGAGYELTGEALKKWVEAVCRIISRA